MGKNRIGTSVLTLALLALPLAACSAEKPTADDAASALAQGLADLDLSAVPLTGADQETAGTELAELTAGLAPFKPTVTVGALTPAEGNDDEATATLSFSWDTGGKADADWSYETSAVLVRGEDDAWQTRWEPAVVFEDLQPGDALVRSTFPANRADILGAGGAVLVTQRPVWRVGLDKTRIEATQVASSATALATMLELDPAAYAAQAQAAGPEAFVEAITLRAEDNQDLTARVREIPGAVALAGMLDLAPSRTFARALLGSTGEATAELIEKSEGRLAAGDITGLSGLQQQYDAQLRGTDGVIIQLATPEGTPPETIFVSAPVDGSALQTTLDPRLQSLAEEVLDAEPSASAIVAIRPSTGEVLTVANGPGSEGRQTALLGQYPPGSTFKMATALAMLRQGKTPDSVLSCPAELTVDGRTFKNAGSYDAAFVGDLPLRTAFAQSCNTAFINARADVPQAALASAAADLGIGVVADALGVPAYFGAVPTAADGTSHAAAMIGQGETLVSPLALAIAGASVGKGSRVSPVLVTGAAEASEAAGLAGTQPPAPTATNAQSPAPEAGPGALTAAEASALRGMMRGVVTEGGVKTLLDVPGEPVLAKTGTAEFGSETPPRTHAWVVALQGDLAVAVFVAEGELGSTSGGPLMKEFLLGAAG